MVAGQMVWGSLPPEIQLMILESLNQDEHCVARYATVCREWQTVIEPKNFNRLKLTLSRLPEFRDMVHRQRRLVKYIWLCIELQQYDCSQCETEETDSWHESNTIIIERAFRELLSYLSTWEPSGNLLLDISVHSPSDSKHHFKYLHFGSDAVPEPEDGQERANTHDPHHGWVNDKQICPPSIRSIYRLFGEIEMPLDFWKDLPVVTAVTGLLLRRQTRCRWEAETLEELLKLLPRLQKFHYEPWREWSPAEQRLTDQSKSPRGSMWDESILIFAISQVRNAYLNLLFQTN